MEYFEITFIINNPNHETKAYSSIKEIIKSSRICSKSDSISVDYYSIWFDLVEDAAVDKLYASFPDIRFSENNLKKLLGLFLEMVSDCFKCVPEIEFATGIYEVSFYYFEDINRTSRLEEFSDDILRHFPFVFYRATTDIKEKAYLRTENAICVFHHGNDVQDIF